MQLLEQMVYEGEIHSDDADVSICCLEAAIDLSEVMEGKSVDVPDSFYKEAQKVWTTIYKWTKSDDEKVAKKADAAIEKARRKKKAMVFFPGSIKCRNGVYSSKVDSCVKGMGYKKSIHCEQNLRTHAYYFLKKLGDGYANLCVTAAKDKDSANEVALFIKYVDGAALSQKQIDAFK